MLTNRQLLKRIESLEKLLDVSYYEYRNAHSAYININTGVLGDIYKKATDKPSVAFVEGINEEQEAIKEYLGIKAVDVDIKVKMIKKGKR